MRIIIYEGETSCPICGGDLEYCDTIRRTLWGGNGKRERLYIRRLKCSKCGAHHNELTERIIPYKRYDAEVIRGVLEGFITDATPGFDRYPCEETFKVWMTQNLHAL